MNAQLSHAEAQARPSSQRQSPIPSQAGHQKMLFVLSVCMALQMTSFVMILPLFSRRFSELGAGVEALGASAMACALTGTLAAPLMGALADRFGRRRLVLGSLAVYVLAFTGYRFASSPLMFILLRAFAGAFTAGLIPAVIGIVADLAPMDRRAQWIGIVNGGASVGWIAGPVLGGELYDHWGYNVALSISIGMAVITFVVALLMVPQTHKNPSRTLGVTYEVRAFPPSNWASSLHTFRSTLPNSISAFLVLLSISFAVMFAWAFIEPKFMFYAYDDLGWSSSMLGLVMSTYGIALTFGEFGLSRLSDSIGRKPVILTGVLLFMAQFLGLVFFRNYILVAASFVLAGLGNALFDPALNAAILDIAPVEHQTRILGIKSAAGSLGNILGPALVVLFTPFLEARGIFLTAAGIVCMSIAVFLSAQIYSHAIHIEPERTN
jgi:DHA1 family multidrug resistance protein-like MFS transporter